MNKYEREQLQKIAKALTSTEDLTQEARLDLVFSALFELDKIQKGQLDGLSEEQLEEVFSGDITKTLIAQISATKDTDNTGIKDVRSILSNAMRNPWEFDLSGKMQLNSFFQPYAETSIAPNLSEKADGDEVGRLLVLKRNWIVRKLLKQDLGAGAQDAQIFVDALRKGDYVIVAGIVPWLLNKFDDARLNPNHEAIGGDPLIPILAYELAKTDIGPEDKAALTHMCNSTAGDVQHASISINTCLDVMLGRLSALKRENPQDTQKQLLERMHTEYENFLKEKDPVKSITKNGCDFNEQDLVIIPFDQQKVEDFANANRNSISANLIVLKTREASPEDTQVLLDVKDRILDYINYLEKNSPAKPSENFNNRLNAANEMLTVLQKGGTIKGDVIPAIKEQMAVIEKNKPGLAELGILGYLVEHLIDRFLPKPTMHKETSKTLEELQTLVEPKKDEPKQEQPEVQSKDREMDEFPPSEVKLK